jgi:hypothetical protein
MAYKDYTGIRFNRLVALWPLQRINKGNVQWMFACDCGIMFSANIRSAVSGHTKSCGCLHREVMVTRNTKHGLSKKHRRSYRTWKDMRSRCLTPTDSDYHNYGGRGISICKEWDDFSAFVSDMGDRPKGMTLDRIDTNGNYDPGNCRWADATTQANNKRTNRIVGPNGETLQQMERITGVGRGTISYRLKHGLDPYTTEDLRK